MTSGSCGGGSERLRVLRPCRRGSQGATTTAAARARGRQRPRTPGSGGWWIGGSLLGLSLPGAARESRRGVRALRRGLFDVDADEPLGVVGRVGASDSGGEP